MTTVTPARMANSEMMANNTIAAISVPVIP
jgi:hypothetical protein